MELIGEDGAFGDGANPLVRFCRDSDCVPQIRILVSRQAFIRCYSRMIQGHGLNRKITNTRIPTERVYYS